MVSVQWIDIAAVVIFSTAVNHLGLVQAIERVVHHKLPIVNCPKCLTFWSTFAYGVSGDGIAALPSELPRLLAISILCSYLAIWLELLMYAIDTLYNRIYGILEENNNKEDRGEDDSEVR